MYTHRPAWEKSDQRLNGLGTKEFFGKCDKKAKRIKLGTGKYLKKL